MIKGADVQWRGRGVSYGVGGQFEQKKGEKVILKKWNFHLITKVFLNLHPRYFGLNQKYSPTSNMRGNREDEYQRNFLCPTQEIKER